MQHLIDELKREGICEDTVDVSSRRGGDTKGHETKHKYYYRLVSDPAYGVLLVHDDADTLPQGRHTYLSQESANLERLRAAGFDVPNFSAVMEVVDHIAGKEAAALIVEHISGAGPYKVTTGISSIRTVVAQADDHVQAQYRQSWERLRERSAVIAPRDHQVMLSHDGRVVTLDVEQLGQGKELRPL